MACTASLFLVAVAGCVRGDRTHPPQASPLPPERPAPHAGMIRGNGRLNLELTQQPGWVEIYVLDAKETPVTVDGVSMHVACHPSAGASRWYTLAPKGGRFGLPWTAADGPLEDATFEVTLARPKPQLDERFDIHLASAAARPLDVKTRVATAARGGVVRQLAQLGRTDGFVTVQVSVAATLADRAAMEQEIGRALVSHPELRLSQAVGAGSAISTGGGGHAHVTEPTLDPFPQLTLDVTPCANTARIVLRRKREEAILWQTGVPLSL